MPETLLWGLFFGFLLGVVICGFIGSLYTVLHTRKSKGRYSMDSQRTGFQIFQDLYPDLIGDLVEDEITLRDGIQVQQTTNGFCVAEHVHEQCEIHGDFCWRIWVISDYGNFELNRQDGNLIILDK